MMKNQLYALICELVIVCLLFFLCSACANRIGPTGGKKDADAPKVTIMVPANQSINYRGRELQIVFNEWVQEDNLMKELLITPPTKEYTYRIQKNRLIIKFKKPLAENVTYSLNFRNAIRDITEKNIIKNLKLAFSTGDRIDSVKIKGKIVDLLTNKGLKDVVVSLYRKDDTLRVDEHEPYYFTYSQPDGTFSLENIRPDTYLIYAIEDKNNNQTYQEPEKIAFQTQSILLNKPDTSIQNLLLKVSREDLSPPLINLTRVIEKRFEIDYNEGLTAAQVIPDDKVKELPFAISANGRTLRIYNPQTVYDSIPLRISSTDSLGNVHIDTLKIKFKEPDEKKRKSTPTNLADPELKLEGETGIENNHVNFELIFEEPVKELNLGKIIYSTDNDTINFLPFLVESKTEEWKWDPTRSRLSIQRNIKFKKNIRIDFEKGAFVSVENDTNRTFSKTFPLKDRERFGSIYGKIQTSKKNYLVQLMDERSGVVDEKISPREFRFEFLPAGTYYLRIVLDENQNGKWDASNFKTGTPPEEILFFDLPNGGKLREKWDIESGLISF